MTRLVLVGEDYYARRIAEAIVGDPRSELTAIYSDLSRDGTLHTFARDAGVAMRGSRILRGSDAVTELFRAADWLINVNSAVIISGAVLKAFHRRALNLHNGPLPEYAGRHVHQWGIRNGEQIFAATIHHMEAGIDTGPIVAARQFPIRMEDTGLSLFRTSFDTGTELFVDVLKGILAGEPLPATPQDISRRRLYRHADALDGRIDWMASPRQIVDFVRAGNYRPLTSPSYTAYVEPTIDERIMVLRANVGDTATADFGTMIEIDDNGPRIACSGGSVRIVEAYRGRVRMKHEDWVAYFDAVPNSILAGRT